MAEQGQALYTAGAGGAEGPAAATSDPPPAAPTPAPAEASAGASASGDASATAERLGTLIDTMQDIVCFKDGQGRWIEANEFALRLFLLQGVDYRGHTDAELAAHSPFYRDAFLTCQASDEQAWTAGVPSRQDQHILRPDGSAQVFDVIKVPTFEPAGQRRGLVVIGRDVTERKQAEEQLRSREGQLRMLLDHTPDIIVRLDRQGRVGYASPSLTRLTGHPTETLLGRSLDELPMPPSLHQFWREQLEEVLRTELPQETEFDLELPGGRLTFDWRLVPEREPGGGVASVLSVARDVTAQRRAEHNYRMLFQQMLDGLVVLEAPVVAQQAAGEPSFRLATANPAFVRLCGRQASRLLGRPLAEVLPDAPVRWWDRLQRVALSGEPAQFEGELTGSRRHYLVRAFRPSVGQVACIFVDITERRRSTEALRATLERLRATTSVLPDPLLVVDTDGVCCEVLADGALTSAELARTLRTLRGRALEELLGPVVATPLLRCVRQVIDGGEPVTAELALPLRSGPRWFEARAARLDRLFEGKLAAILLLRDITARHEADRERAQLEEQLRQAQKMESVGRLAGGVAHDFNNLLSPILGHVDLLALDLAPGDPRQDQLGQMRRAAERARDLTRQLLAFSRKQMLALTPLDLRPVLRGFHRMLQRTVREDIRLELRLPEQLGLVRADAGQIEQVVMNLAINAQDAMPTGGTLTLTLQQVELEEEQARLLPGASPGPQALLTVRDAGCGMAPAILERVFEPFFTTKEVGRGTGLGLSTVYGIVRQHNGCVQVESEVGRGTCFSIYLPVTTPAGPEVSAEPVAAVRHHAPGRGVILVVEDNELVRSMTRQLLQRQGYRVLEAAGGEQCLARVEQLAEPIALLLTDVVMPAMNGRQLYARLQARQPDLRVLYMSGYTRDVIAAHGVLDAGVHFIQKPFDTGHLLQQIDELLASGPERPPA